MCCVMCYVRGDGVLYDILYGGQYMLCDIRYGCRCVLYDILYVERMVLCAIRYGELDVLYDMLCVGRGGSHMTYYTEGGA